MMKTKLTSVSIARVLRARAFGFAVLFDLPQWLVDLNPWGHLVDSRSGAIDLSP